MVFSCVLNQILFLIKLNFYSGILLLNMIENYKLQIQIVSYKLSKFQHSSYLNNKTYLCCQDLSKISFNLYDIVQNWCHEHSILVTLIYNFISEKIMINVSFDNLISFRKKYYKQVIFPDFSYSFTLLKPTMINPSVSCTREKKVRHDSIIIDTKKSIHLTFLPQK